MTFSKFWELIKKSGEVWWNEEAPQKGAAIAYYGIFSIAPLLLMALAIAGFFYDQGETRQAMTQKINEFLGETVGPAINELLKNASGPGQGIFSFAFGFLLLIVGASGVFVQLQDSLNKLWNVEPKPNLGIWGVLWERLLSFLALFLTGFLLLASLVASAVIASIGNYLEPEQIPGGPWLWTLVDLAVSLLIISLLFAMIYKVLPAGRVSWSDALIGGLMTAVLFLIGKYLVSLYLGFSSTASVFGAAGSLVVVLVWVYYSAQIVLMGAAFTRVYANMVGDRVRTTEKSRYVEVGSMSLGARAPSA